MIRRVGLEINFLPGRSCITVHLPVGSLQESLPGYILDSTVQWVRPQRCPNSSVASANAGATGLTLSIPSSLLLDCLQFDAIIIRRDASTNLSPGNLIGASLGCLLRHWRALQIPDANSSVYRSISSNPIGKDGTCNETLSSRGT
jgi:hypothetical protein